MGSSNETRGARESVDPKFTFSAAMRDARTPTKVNFYGLSRAVQERFVASTRGAAAPAPILFRRASRVRIFVWLAAAAALGASAAIVSRVGVGDVESAVALHGKGLLGVYAALIAASAFAVVRALALVRSARSLPFTPGLYVFPASVIDASSHVLRVHAMRDLASMDRKPTPVSTFHFAFVGGKKFAFAEPDLDKADAAERALLDARTALATALEDESPRALAGIDPLYDAALSSPLGPSQPLERSVPAWSKLGWAIALGVAALVAPLMWTTRNASSDAKMFAAVEQSKSVAMYKRYLSQGGRRSEEVRDILLPRAELREAEKTATVEAMQAYVSSHPSSKIAGEVATSVRKVMLVELEKAKTERTVTALKAFAKRYPDHKLEPELRAATHALYTSALDGYRHMGPEKDLTGAVPVIQRALAFAEKSGPDAEIRFRLRPSKTLDAADAQLAKSKHWTGAESKPSPYFAAGKLRPREEAVAKVLVDRFSEAFPADVLSVKLGAPITDDGALPAFKVPTLVVDYAVEWSHTAAVSTRPHGIFAGVNVPFEITFQVPDGAKALRVQLLSWRGPDVWKRKDDPAGERGALESKVYGQMIDGSFGELQKKALDTFFRLDAK